MTFFSRPKREIYRRKILGFWTDFSHNKIGFAGIILISIFVVMALTAPILTPYTPATQLTRPEKVAMPYACPAWFAYFPGYNDLNPTIKINPNVTQASIISQEGPLQINLANNNINFTPTEAKSQKATITLDLGNFSYTYAPPLAFTIYTKYKMNFNRTKLAIYFIIKNYTAMPAWESNFKYPDKAEILIATFTPPPVPVGGIIQNTTSGDVALDSTSSKVITSLFKSLTNLTELRPAPLVFSEKSTYGIQLRIEFSNIYPYKGAYAEFYLWETRLTIWGRLHGILGTDFSGSDAWTELVYGSRISLMVGILAAALATFLGITYGVISGYVGGFVDEMLMRIVDILLCIPVLPILLVLIRYFRPNVYWVVVLIAIFGWQGLSRVIRSRVLSLKEMAFIESARAAGASDTYIMFRHLIPNVLPIAMAAMVLSVPAAIITEASLSFLGFGDPNAATWGRMLYNAYQLGGINYWWIWVPPGISIVLICVGFVFVGHAVDEIVNPRLRRRR